MSAQKTFIRGINMNNSLLDSPQLMHLGPAVSQYIHHSSLLLVRAEVSSYRSAVYLTLDCISHRWK